MLENVIVNLVCTIVGGILFTVILFVFNEYIIRKKNITGVWNVTLRVDDSTYNPYKGVVIEYVIHVLQQGYEIIGSGEKIRDVSSAGNATEYEHSSRIIGSINGYYERRFISKSKVYFHYVEDGHKRQTRSIFTLAFKSRVLLVGSFSSTAASSKGTIEMRKDD